jgi:multidrug efflux pump
MIMIEDRGSVVGPSVLQAQTMNLVERGNSAELKGTGLPRDLNGFALKLLPAADGPGALPTKGEALIVAADVGGVPYIRVFDDDGKRVMDVDGAKATGPQAQRFKDLDKLLRELGPRRRLDEKDRGRLLAAVKSVEDKHPALTGLSSVFRANVPQLYADINRTACMAKQVALRDLFDTLQIYLGSLYVNDFNRFGRTWQVIVQADASYRNRMEDIKKLKVRNLEGTMVPVGSLATIEERTGPLILTRYNMYPAAQINGSAAPGISSGQAIALMEQLAREELPPSMGYEWTELAYLELKAGNTAMKIFGMAVLFVFLVLAAQYESWSLPLAVILVVPMCLLGGIAGVSYTGRDVNIFTQIGFVVLVGLASKNAILIVEFAKMRREAGESRREATLDACRLRLRPIVMTSLAFILGVVPLIVGRGAGAEMRQTLGTTVFSGMIGVTVFGLLLTPVFFSVIDWLGGTRLFSSRAVRLLGGWAIDAISLRPVRKLVGRAARGGAKPARPEGSVELD